MKVSKPFILAPALLIATLSGAAMAREPQVATSLPPVTVKVHWSTKQELEKMCGVGMAGCLSPATPSKPYAQIWAEKPLGWEDDDRVCALGDQVLRMADNLPPHVAAPTRSVSQPASVIGAMSR